MNWNEWLKNETDYIPHNFSKYEIFHTMVSGPLKLKLFDIEVEFIEVKTSDLGGEFGKIKFTTVNNSRALPWVMSFYLDEFEEEYQDKNILKSVKINSDEIEFSTEKELYLKIIRYASTSSNNWICVEYEVDKVTWGAENEKWVYLREEGSFHKSKQYRKLIEDGWVE